MPDADEAVVGSVNGDRRAADAATTRARLIDATMELFAESGYEGTRVQRIARRAGMTTGAIYANFASKEELLAEAIGQASLEALRSEMSPVLEGLTSYEILQVLGKEALGVPPSTNHGMIVQGVAAASRNRGLRDTVVNPIDDLAASVRVLFADAQAKGDISSDLDLDALVFFAMTLAFGAFTLKAIDWPMPDRDALDTLITRILDRFSD